MKVYYKAISSLKIVDQYPTGCQSSYPTNVFRACIHALISINPYKNTNKQSEEENQIMLAGHCLSLSLKTF